VVALPKVMLIYFEGCPHWRTALEHLEQALDRVGRSDPVTLRLVTNESEAQKNHMAGSPTILINGRDPFPGGGPTWGCRLYPSEAGSIGAPSIDSLVELLS
jgi:hypothetical protein